MAMTKEIDSHEARENESGEEAAADCSRPEITTKYNTAAVIVNEVLQKVLDACIAGADIVTICELGDNLIEERTAKVYTKKEKGEKVRRGVAFPTCISVNEIIANFSPLSFESKKLKEGDLVKAELGAHIDGFIATAANTIVVGKDEVTGRQADVIKAAWTAAEAALRTIVVGGNNAEVTSVMNRCVSEFNCNMVAGTMSHQMKQHVIDGVKCIASKESIEDKTDSFEFELNETYAVNVIVSTGEGKMKETDCRCTVFKRDVEQNYTLKTAHGRQFLSEVNSRFPSLPFSLRSIADVNCARMGIHECSRHQLFDPYPVYADKAGEFVAQFKFTILLLPGGTKKIAGLPLNQVIRSDFEIKDEEMKKLLASTANPKKKKKKARQGLKEGTEPTA